MQMLFANFARTFATPVHKNVTNTRWIIVQGVPQFVSHVRKNARSWPQHNDSIFVWLVSVMRLPLRSTSRSRAVVARRAHNPKVGSSNLPFATKKVKPRFGFLFS